MTFSETGKLLVALNDSVAMVCGCMNHTYDGMEHSRKKLRGKEKFTGEQGSAIAVLDDRYAKGEPSLEEYVKMKDVIKGNEPLTLGHMPLMHSISIKGPLRGLRYCYKFNACNAGQCTHSSNGKFRNENLAQHQILRRRW